jgi:hypothetical protein
MKIKSTFLYKTLVATTFFSMLIAAPQSVFAQIGPVDPPTGTAAFGTTAAAAFTTLVTILMRTIVVIAGIYAIFNLLLAGLAFMSAGGDPKKIADAWAKIWQTVIGLLITAGAFVIGGIISYLLFGQANIIFSIRIFGPGP